MGRAPWRAMAQSSLEDDPSRTVWLLWILKLCIGCVDTAATEFGRSGKWEPKRTTWRSYRHQRSQNLPPPRQLHLTL